MTTTPESLCATCIHALEDVKGQDIKSLDVRGMTSITDFMVICSASSSRQLNALADNVVKEAKNAGARPLNRNYERQDEWALVDLGDVLVHIMLPKVREYYALEKLWQTPEDDENHTN